MSLRGLSVTLGSILVLFCVADGYAQEQPVPADTTARDSSRVVPDTAAADTTAPATASSPQSRVPDDGPNASTASAGGGGTPDEAVSFSARDSLVLRTTATGEDYGTLHGNAKMSYQGASLTAGTIDMNFQTGTLEAQGAPSDSVQGKRALFERSGGGGGTDGGPGGGGSGGQSFTGDVLSYNLGTKRGRVVAARTQRQEGFVEGEAVKVFEDSTLFVRDGLYTTCDCPPDQTPSYSLRSDEMKLSEQWVYTGPIQLYLFNVPTPLWLPFGFLPNTQGRRSGPLPPQYGEDRRGFFLKDWGWYFALNPYTDFTIRAGIWSQGSYELRPRFRYKKRYSYDGDLRLTYRREQIGEEIDPNFQNRREGQLQWNHRQQFSPRSQLKADVNLTTSSDFARRNSDNYADAVQQQIRSTVDYQTTWANGKRQLTVRGDQRQQLQTGNVDLTLPNLSFSQNSFKPFEREQRIGDPTWYEKLTTSYSVNVSNVYNFDPRDPENLRRNGTPADSALANRIERADIDWYEALTDRRKYELATGNDRPFRFEARHRIPLSVKYRVERYNLSLEPRIEYNSDWFLNTTRKTARRDSTGGLGTITQRTDPGFYARHTFDTRMTARTDLFGTFPIGLGPFEGLRHRLSPSLSMNYEPNFNNPFWGQTRVLRFPDGTPVRDPETGEVRRYNIRGGGRVRGSNQRWALDLGLDNVFQTKRVRTDTTGQTTKETVTLLNLNVSGLSYNFAADSLRVGERIRVNARTSIDPFNVDANWTFSPYALRRTQAGRFQQVDRLMIAESPLTPARLTNFQLSVGADLSSTDSRRPPSANRNGSQSPRPQTRRDLSTLRRPWSLGLDFTYRISRPRKEITSREATLGVDFDLNVTSKWQIRGNTGYDFIQGEVSTTDLSITRNLGCWDLSFSWVPFGRFQTYSFKLQVSSGHLSQLLKLPIPNKGGEGRLGGFTDRLRQTAQSGLQNAQN